MRKKRKIYYSDLLNDDFASNDIVTKPLPKNYSYIKCKVRIFFANLFYYSIVPILYIMQKIVYGEKIVGKKKLKPFRKNGYFLYGNHTRGAGDAYTPSLISFPKKAYIITNPDSMAVPFVNRITEDLGNIPLPTKDDFTNFKKYFEAIKYHAKLNHVITIYPEAHIWPLYTKIRPFIDTSFKYPIITDKPVFCFTVTYSKRKIIKTPKTTVYIDGPFFPNTDKAYSNSQEELRNAVYEQMRKRSKLSKVEFIKYVYKKK